MMTKIAVGTWVLVPGYSGPMHANVFRVDAVTEKLIKQSSGRRFTQKYKADVMAVFPTEEMAYAYRDKISGIRGERDRRVSAANKAAIEQVQKLIEAYQPA